VRPEVRVNRILPFGRCLVHTMMPNIAVLNGSKNPAKMGLIIDGTGERLP
jgi:hypothetical protein